MACLFGFLAAQADPIVEFVLGSKWSPIVPFLIILSIGGVFQTASSASQWVIMARGHGGAFLRLMLLTRSTMIVVIVISSAWGTIGVACAYTGSCIVILVVGTLWAGRVADAPVSALLGNVLVATVGYAFCSLVSYFAGLFLPSGDFVLRIIVGAAAMAIALGVVCLYWPAFRRDLRSAVGVIGLMLPGSRLRSPKRPAPQEATPPPHLQQSADHVVAASKDINYSKGG
jgi:PST family polysaccharide transporter